MKIAVWDEDGSAVESFEVGGYSGCVGSKIQYSLIPDIDGSDEAVVGMGDLIGRVNGKAVGYGREKEGCTGSWNSAHGKGKKWWAHQERPRVREVKLGLFFSGGC